MTGDDGDSDDFAADGGTGTGTGTADESSGIDGPGNDEADGGSGTTDESGDVDGVSSSGSGSPAIAALFSLLVPGLGQMYLGRKGRGKFVLMTAFAWFVLVGVVGFVLVPNLLFLLPMSIIVVGVMAATDAYRLGSAE